MKKILLFALLLMVAGMQTMWGQGFRVYKSDGTVAQFSLRTDSIVFYDGIGTDEDFGPFTPVNQMIVGTWYAPDGTSFTLNEDGTTNFPNAATYKFRPYLGTLMFYDVLDKPVKTIVLNEVEKKYLLAVNYITGTYTYYTNSGSLVTNMTMNKSSLTMNSGTTAQLSVTITPAGAFNPHVTWSSSDESIATVDQNGLVTALVGGSVTITATATDGSGLSATCVITITQMVTSIILSQSYVALELDAFVRLTATILPANAANKNVVWSSSNGDVAAIRNGRVDAYDYGEAIITCAAADGSGVIATCKVTVYNSEYVDLGLPSGTLWAACNIGAYSSEGYGDYFRWGETTKYDGNGGGATYKWRGDSDIDFIKYNTLENRGIVDNMVELEPNDDAAYVNWGNQWRMPSVSQMGELINTAYTTIEWTTFNNIQGYKITSKTNGKYLFLPASGCLYGSAGVAGIGSVVYYVGRYISSNEPAAAITLMPNDESLQLTYLYATRLWGCSIRPVRNSE